MKLSISFCNTLNVICLMFNLYISLVVKILNQNSNYLLSREFLTLDIDCFQLNFFNIVINSEDE